MNTSLFMDKQIMDLSNSQSNSYDSIDLMSKSEENSRHIGGDGDGAIKKEDIVPSYDFQPIRPIGTSSPPASIASGNVNIAGARPWGSADSKSNTSPIRNYGSLDSLESAKVVIGKDRDSIDATLLSEIDRTMKKYADNLLNTLEGVSARLSQLETRNRQLENSVDDLKLSVGNIHGSTDGKMRHLENILREVQTGIQVIKDKQEIMDTHLQLAKLQVSKGEQQPEVHNSANLDSAQTAASAPQQYPQQLPPVSHLQPPPVLPPPNAPPQQLPPVSHLQPPPVLPPPNAPPPPPPQQNLPQHLQLPNQFPSNQIPSVPQHESYFPQPGQTPDNANHKYQIPPSQQMHPASQSPPQQQYQAPPQSQYSQPPPPPQLHPSLPAVSPQSQPPLGHHSKEIPYMQSQNYPPGIHQPPHSATGAPPAQQFYGAPPNMYEPQSGKPGPGFPGAYGPPSGPGEPYSYSSSTSQYGSGSPRKSQHLSAPPMGQSSGTGYPQLPTAKILPQALPTASPIGGGSGSGSGGGNRVPVDDVVDKVTNMGFPRDVVRATVRRLTENGQSVDLNVVLDKLMNDGKGGPPRGWFGR